MMEGVEILSSETIYNTILPEWWAGVGFLVLIFGGLICAILCGYTKYPTIGATCLVLAACLCGSLLYCALSDNKNDVNYIEYKVTIDDSVSMNEFLDKYEILDQEGKIYTVKERE
jgi:hypothetical protein